MTIPCVSISWSSGKLLRQNPLPPPLDILRSAVDRADDQSIASGKGVLAPNVEQQRRRCRAQTRIKVVWRN